MNLRHLKAPKPSHLPHILFRQRKADLWQYWRPDEGMWMFFSFNPPTYWRWDGDVEISYDETWCEPEEDETWCEPEE